MEFRAVTMVACALTLSAITGCDKISTSSGASRGDAAPAPAQTTAPTPTPAPAPTAQAAKEGDLEVRAKTPDEAVKTWWRYIDLREAAAVEDCKATVAKPKRPFQLRLKEIVGPEIAVNYDGSKVRCTLDVFQREIDKVDVETETRAVVYATLRNATPIEPGVVPTEKDIKTRAEGEKFKYVLEASDGGWKIVQIFDKGFGGGGSTWEKHHTSTTSGPFVPTLVLNP